MTTFERIPVFLDPGHGGEHTGVVANNIVEKFYVATFANALYWVLHDTHWFRPHISRGGDENISLDDAGEIAEKCSAKFALAIHVNANDDPRVSGMMTFYMSGDEIGSGVAAEMQRNAPPGLTRTSDSPIMGLQSAWPRVYNVLLPYRKREIPAVLIELGFATNEKNALMLNAPLVRQQLLGTIIRGLEHLKYVYGE